MAARFTGPVAAGLVAVCSASLSSVVTTTQDGVFSPDQAERGRVVYESHCIACHETDFYQEKLAVWQSELVVDFFDALSATMPAENPGGLTNAQYLDVLAYVFSITGSPAGDAELTLDTIASIEIVTAE